MSFIVSKMSAVTFAAALSGALMIGLPQASLAQSGSGAGSSMDGLTRGTTPSASPGSPATTSPYPGRIRQPRPSAKSADSDKGDGSMFGEARGADDILAREQHILEGKLKSICRGC